MGGGEGEGGGCEKGWGGRPWVGLHAGGGAVWTGGEGGVAAMLSALQGESARWRKTGGRSLGIVFESAWPSRLSGLIQGSNPTLSLRPSVAKKPGGSVVEAVDGEGPAASAWPMGEVYALHDPFFIAMKQWAPADQEEAGQDAR